MLKTFLSIGIWIYDIALTIILFFVVLFFWFFLYPFDKKRRVAHSQCFWWSEAIVSMNPFWKLKVSGLENIDHKRTYVIIANHESMADIVVLYKTRMQFKWVSKESLFQVPFIGWCLSLTRHIKLARGEYSSIKKVYREAAEWLRSGMSVLFFPEGTRSDTAEMNVFQNGAFKLAIREKMPILPIAIRGTGGAITKGSWLFTAKIPVSLKVLPSIDASKFHIRDFAALRDQAREAIEKA